MNIKKKKKEKKNRDFIVLPARTNILSSTYTLYAPRHTRMYRVEIMAERPVEPNEQAVMDEGKFKVQS